MPRSAPCLARWTSAALLLLAPLAGGLAAADKEMIPPQLPQEQRDHLQRFLQQHEKPDRFLPADAKLVGAPAEEPERRKELPAAQPVKQYLVQILSPRPVPGQEEPKQVEVYYYRPNPERGKRGITVRYRVDLTTGQQLGPTEVLFNSHTPLSRQEVAEAVELARQQAPALQALYQGRDPSTIHWEYLQTVISRKHDPHEPGDRVARFVFTAAGNKDEAPPPPVRLLVNLTKGVVVPETR